MKKKRKGKISKLKKRNIKFKEQRKKNRKKRELLRFKLDQPKLMALLYDQKSQKLLNTHATEHLYLLKIIDPILLMFTASIKSDTSPMS